MLIAASLSEAGLKPVDHFNHSVRHDIRQRQFIAPKRKAARSMGLTRFILIDKAAIMQQSRCMQSS